MGVGNSISVTASSVFLGEVRVWLIFTSLSLMVQMMSPAQAFSMR